MTVKGVIFDFDGTLADTLPGIFRAFRHCFMAHLGKNFTDKEIEELFGPTEDGIIKRLVPERWESCHADYLAAYRQHHPRQAFTDIERALALLKQRGVRLAIGTGKGKGSLLASLDIIGLADYFDRLEYGSEDGGVKPEIIGRILRHWGVKPEETAYLGDVASDVDAARKAGVTALSAGWSDGADMASLAAAKPDALFCTVGDFIQWIRENCPSQDEEAGAHG